MISVTVLNLDSTVAALGEIPANAKKAIKKASRKTLQAAKREAIAKVKARYTSPISIFTQSLTIKTKSTGGELKSKGGKNPLYKFKTTPQGRIRARGRYIHATVVKGQGDTLKKAFRMSKGPNIFERVGESRKPIKKLYSVAAPSMLNVPQVREPVMQKIETMFPQEFFASL